MRVRNLFYPPAVCRFGVVARCAWNRQFFECPMLRGQF